MTTLQAGRTDNGTPLANSIVGHCLEQITEWAQEKFGESEIVSAKEAFFDRTGKVFPDDPFYNQRMNYFHDFFLFARPLSPEFAGYRSQTPFEAFRHYVFEAGSEVSDDDRRRLTDHRHSVFVVKSTKEGVLVLIDLISDSTVTVHEKDGESFRWIAKGTIFQSFLYEFDGKLHLGQGLIFHPRELLKTLRKELKVRKKMSQMNRSEFLGALAQLEIRCQRQRHRNPLQLYRHALAKSTPSDNDSR